jgi:hypothetical protein
VPRKLHFYDLGELRHRYFAGEPDARIARALGVHASVIRRLIRERGLRVRGQLEINQRLADEKTDAEHCARTALMRAAKAVKARLRQR